MGASGAGKTTILRAIAGLELDGGSLIVSGTVSRPSTGRNGFSTPSSLCEYERSTKRMAGARPRVQACLGPMPSAGAGAARVAWRRRPRGAHASRAVRRGSAAGRDRACDRHRAAGAADGRADRLARSGSPRSLAATLRQLATEGRTIVIATHDAEFARAVHHRVLAVEDGNSVSWVR